MTRELMQKFNPLEHPVCLEKPLRIAPSTWVGHVPFALFLVDILRPATIVELGTQYGVSYCAFCQAVSFLKLNTRCYAVDTWRGEEQAGPLSDDVLVELKRHHDPLYSGFSELIQSAFDDAVDRFADDTIDLLHIDGFHTYDAAKNDFDRWLPKMSRRGVILFHDIAVKKPDFGVWKLWDELKAIYPGFEFPHWYGLGVLAVGREYPSSLDVLLRAGNDAPAIQEYFNQMGSKEAGRGYFPRQAGEKEGRKLATGLRRIRSRVVRALNLATR
jgi:hypothetical protein